MTGSVDLQRMLRTLETSVRPEPYTYVTVPAGHPALLLAHAMVAEDEGMTVVLPLAEAQEHRLEYTFIAAWITLEVHSSLEAVGLTAAVAHALAAEGISCNVLAGFYHDHLLVPYDRADEAIAALSRLRERASEA